MTPTVHVLPQRKRQFIFISMVVLFVVAIPVLIFLANGWRLTSLSLSEKATVVQTGGIYVASDQTGVLMFIDDELVRETRTFRKALYAAGITSGKHRITVQKDGYRTWVKEIDVLPSLVVDAFAFNLPEKEVLLPVASTTELYTTLQKIFIPIVDRATTTATSTSEKSLTELHAQVEKIKSGAEDATTTAFVPVREKNGVQLFDKDDEVYARYAGTLSKMPYYYCPKVYVRPEQLEKSEEGAAAALSVKEVTAEDDSLLDAPEPLVCDPTIKLDRQYREVRSYDFFPGTTDLVIMEREDGIFLTEIDNRGFQNTQPLATGENLKYTVYNDDIYLYDGEKISQIIIE